MSYFILCLFSIFQLSTSLYIPCVTFNQNCYNQTCCEPYICYEQLLHTFVCIGMNETKN